MARVKSIDLQRSNKTPSSKCYSYTHIERGSGKQMRTGRQRRRPRCRPTSHYTSAGLCSRLCVCESRYRLEKNNTCSGRFGRGCYLCFEVVLLSPPPVPVISHWASKPSRPGLPAALQCIHPDPRRASMLALTRKAIKKNTEEQ